MTVHRLALISTMALGLAFAGSAFAQEQDQQHETHHDAAGATSGGEATAPAPAAGEDDAAADAMQMDGAGMMMCSRMMAMMGDMMKGGGHAGPGGMKGHGMQMMKDHPPMMGGHMKGHGKAGMAQHGMARLLSADEVGKRLGEMIAHNKRLKVGKLEPGGDFTLAAEITTVDGSLVHKLLIDRRDGTAYEAE